MGARAGDLASAVDAARTKAFVGRTAELACFRTALGGTAPYRVLLVHGAGGLGKSTLLHRFRTLAEADGRPVVRIDGEDVDGSPEGVRAAIATAQAGVREAGSGWVLLIDAYERLQAIDGWIRDELVASLSDDTVVVLAGRNPPERAWRTDPGWRPLVRSIPLGPLDADESLLMLERAGVDPGRCAQLATLAAGHPLALAMLAEAEVSGELPREVGDDVGTGFGTGTGTGLDDAPELVAALAPLVTEEAPDADHTLAAALCAHAWLTTQDLLEAVLGRPAPREWSWLESRPWVAIGTYGVYPHDLVRDVLDADLRRRSPQTYARLNDDVHRRAWQGLRSDDESERRLWAHQKLFLHRRSPLAASFWTLRTAGTGLVSTAAPRDREAVLDLERSLHGDASARLAERWFEAQPENLWVARRGTEVAGYVFHALLPTDPALVDDDPVTAAALEHVVRTSPARPGEQVSLSRFLGGRGEGERDPYAVVAGSVGSTVLWTSRPLAWSFTVTTDPEFWRPIFSYLALTTELEVVFDGRPYALFGIDWRLLTPHRWFQMLGERELTGESGPPPPRLLSAPPLSRDAFTDAVRQALRDLHRPDRLAASALVGTRLIAADDSEPGDAPRDAELVRAVVLAGVAAVAGEPRSASWGRVLDRTFVHAAPTQEAAAEVLGLPFSTYRRHLGRAVERLVDLLWAVEIGELGLPAADRATGQAGQTRADDEQHLDW